MSTKKNNGLKIICLNRKASFNYFLSDLFEAGLVLRGSEINQLEVVKQALQILMVLRRMVKYT